MRKFDRVIAVSEATKRLMIRSGVPEGKITVIYNGIDTHAWSPSILHEKEDPTQSHSKPFPVIGYVGRITPEKNLTTWLKVAAIVSRRYPNAQFFIIGEGKDGVLKKKLERQASELKLDSQMNFAGYQSFLQPYYAKLDVFLLTSDREGLPNCVLEAMAMGIPVVTTGVGGAPELVENGRTGYVAQVDNVENLSNAIISIVEDDELRLRLGMEGRKRIEKFFSFNHRLKKIEDLYETLVKRKISQSC